MSNINSSPWFSVTHEDFAAWSQQLQAETDRGLATAAAAILDHMLARLIECFLVDDPQATERLLGKPFSPLGTFAARTAAAYSLGLISSDERDDLDSIRNIRNDFAHQPTSPAFSDESIAKNVRKLKMPKLMPKVPSGPFEKPPRELFIMAVTMLQTFIDIRTRSTERRTSAKHFKMVAT
ncbi:MAG: MltR family transcriptional regulator [Anaerolineales bacterium]|nr:MltR family transcriptional regulator [Anaerolineales bacterium]